MKLKFRNAYKKEKSGETHNRGVVFGVREDVLPENQPLLKLEVADVAGEHNLDVRAQRQGRSSDLRCTS